MTGGKYDCQECGHTNHVPEEVMVACSEHIRPCEECGKKAKFNFATYHG